MSAPDSSRERTYVTSFVGRQDDVARLSAALRNADLRLVSLVGPGGVGKTRLAVETAQIVDRDFVHGHRFVDLSQTIDARTVPEEVARSLGIAFEDTITVERVVDHLRPMNLLLILDNFERVIEARSFIRILIERCPNMVVMITSRQTLNITGEYLMTIHPLAIPEPGQTLVVDVALQIASIRLFRDRARQADVRFELGSAELPAVSEICRKLDGLPLAIELAAAKISMFSVGGLLTQLSKVIPALTGGPVDADERHQTMRATVEWSYVGLDESAKILFRRLSIFAGTYSIERAANLVRWMSLIDDSRSQSNYSTLREAFVLAPEPDITALQRSLKSLYDVSLITRGGSAGQDDGFRFLQTIREFARLLLEESDEYDTVALGHACVALDSVLQNRSRSMSSDREGWLARMERDVEEYRASLRWAAARATTLDIGLRLLDSTFDFWLRSGRAREARTWIALLTKSYSGPESSSLARAFLLLGHVTYDDLNTSLLRYERALAISRQLPGDGALTGILSHTALTLFALGDENKAIERINEAVASAELFGDRRALSLVLDHRGYLHSKRGDYLLALESFERALDIQVDLGLLDYVPETELLLGRAFVLAGRVSDGTKALHRALQAFSQLGAIDRLGIVYMNLGLSYAKAGQLRTAGEYYRYGLREFEQGRYYEQELAESLDQLSEFLRDVGRIDTAAMIVSFVDGLRARTSVKRSRDLNRRYERTIHAVRTILGEERFSELQRHGVSMTLVEVISLALAISLDDLTDAEVFDEHSIAGRVLTPKEREISCLLYLTNRQISEVLNSSENTVRTHVANIFSKLAVKKRTKAYEHALKEGWCQGSPE